MSQWRRTRLEDISSDTQWHPAGPSGGDALEQLKTAAFCAICSDTSIAPILTICGHTFCMVCWNRWVDTCRAKGQRVQCPTCKKRTKHMQLVAPNRPLRHLLEQFVQWRCPKCPERCTTQEEAEKHATLCPNRIVKCTGCGEQGKRNIMRITHPLVCPLWPTPCENAPHCKYIVPRSELATHMEVCPFECDDDDGYDLQLLHEMINDDSSSEGEYVIDMDDLDDDDGLLIGMDDDDDDDGVLSIDGI